MEKFVRINNCLIDPSKISAIVQDEKDINIVKVFFDSGERLVFEGSEAMDLWKEFDESAGDWRKPE